MEIRPSLLALGELSNNKLDVIRQCQKWGLLPHEGSLICPWCGEPLKLCVSSRALDGYHWVCNRKYVIKKKGKKCETRISLRTGTFFEKSQLSIIKILAFMSMWIQTYKYNQVHYQLEISCQTYTVWSSFCREVAYKSMIEKGEPIGGDGQIVEFKESKLSTTKSFVFGGCERGSGRIFMVSVKDRTRETLLSIIKKWILPGTEIISDCWRSDDSLSNKVYQDENLHHTLHFVDPTTGDHTKSIESVWNAAKMSITPPNRKGASLPGNLARYMLIKKAEALGRDPTLYFYELAGQIYNPLAQRDNNLSESEDMEEVVDSDAVSEEELDEEIEEEV